MRIAKIIGNVTLSECHPSFVGASLKLAVPQTLENLTGASQEESDTLVVYDELGAGNGCLIALCDGSEAAQPFRPDLKPVSAYNSAIIDQVNISQ